VGAREVLLLFAQMALGHLMLELIALVALIRYRALVPLVYLMLLGEHVARRLIAWSHGTESTAVALSVNYGLLTLLTLGLALSLVPRRTEPTMENGQ